jgi:hypothetical protein
MVVVAAIAWIFLFQGLVIDAVEPSKTGRTHATGEIGFDDGAFIRRYSEGDRGRRFSCWIRSLLS